MNPREVDALIAEHIFDWSWHSVSDYLQCGFDEVTKCSTDRDGYFLSPLTYIPNDELKKGWCTYIPQPVPHYSTDIAAAWEVVEKMDCRTIEITKHANSYQCVFAYKEYGRFFYELECDTAPMAICLAALKAKGINVPDETFEAGGDDV